MSLTSKMSPCPAITLFILFRVTISEPTIPKFVSFPIFLLYVRLQLHNLQHFFVVWYLKYKCLGYPINQGVLSRHTILLFVGGDFILLMLRLNLISRELYVCDIKNILTQIKGYRDSNMNIVQFRVSNDQLTYPSLVMGTFNISFVKLSFIQIPNSLSLSLSLFSLSDLRLSLSPLSVSISFFPAKPLSQQMHVSKQVWKLLPRATPVGRVVPFRSERSWVRFLRQEINSLC